jgi:NADPH:quinone reductase-like Zn-dependent oxidoreductase
LKAGAAHVVVTEEKDVEEEIKRLTDGKGARVVFDAAGGPSFAKLVSSASMDGLLLTYGVLSNEMNSFPAIQVLRRTVDGTMTPAWTRSKPTSSRDSRPVRSNPGSQRRFPSKVL